MAPVFTNSQGNPVPEPFATQRIGKHGPLLLQDVNLIDNLAHFDRERIPERVVHAKGSGAYGMFEVTDDITDVCSAKFLDTVGKKTKIFSRFSQVTGEQGYSDTVTDARGFSTKLYTEEGILDLFPHFIHTQKRNPETHLKDANMFWDYLTSNPGSVHQVCFLFSDRGTPASYRNMHGFSGHTYKWANSKGEWHCIQTMTEEQAKKSPFSVFDLTKVWPHKDYPLRRFGKFTLNENPKNYFAEVEQAAFSPANTVPSMQPSADPVLQSRLFSYADTQRHRLGTNYVQIPVNSPLHGTVYAPNVRDGAMTVNGNLGATPNYLASDIPVEFKQASLQEDQEAWEGAATPFHWKATPYEWE
ncbi:hypothetical protein CANMA_003584 [Candida margitis]|uniref:uncharacterized protein n=1 Tax=Candida margitis TaxID=1775924 RepID=UPI002227EC9E|nr:uncharacterized protein CANMA_003584 [Candida margitis]KAI5963987.1 hypothetical protein CANMA_003584 [Candida margitis]